MQSSRFHGLAVRFFPQKLRTSFRRSSTSSTTSSSRESYTSTASSPVSTINSIIFRQPSIVDMEEERRVFPGELSLLEPRPIVYWGGLEERLCSL
ncbi:calcium channel subunit cch1 [Ophiostoma piceae UAMH 11346]|uniref:Calcium channel subunit cch1 n=1 Tax=Ophiostoma piceae (strain UAMH 11346) TaxID=1262450 RepID=S3BYZ1_OPHP1|nr:calcium channel subunit cch1 [Ophiostoma piceae UAMH 11346]